MKRILVCEFLQETNTFNPIVCTAENFNSGKAFEGKEIFKELMSIKGSVHGAVDAITQAGGEAIPTIFMDANSGGRVEDSVLQLMKDRMKYYAETVGEFDGIFASLHGATCTEGNDDACGNFLKCLRKLAGNKPIAVSCDLHANITKQMLENADIICGYQTYPHIDHYEVGYRAAALCMEKLCGKQLYMATVHLPLLIPPAGYTTNQEPFKTLMQSGHEMVEKGILSDFSVFAVQPWLDIEKISSTVVTVSNDAKKAKECAEILAKEFLALRDKVQPEMLSVDEIIDFAENNDTGKPVILADSADSPNGGAVGDSAEVAIRLQQRGSNLRVGMFVLDKQAVQKAFDLGVGGTGEFTVGAKYTKILSGAFKAVGTVCSLHNGYYRLEGPANKGMLSSIGRSAVVSFGKIDILLCESGGSSGDPQIFRHFGIEPLLYDLIVVKANTSFREPYSKISDLIFVADTLGAGASNLLKLKWENLPNGLYPFDLSPDYKIKKSKIW